MREKTGYQTIDGRAIYDGDRLRGITPFGQIVRGKVEEYYGDWVLKVAHAEGVRIALWNFAELDKVEQEK